MPSDTLPEHPVRDGYISGLAASSLEHVEDKVPAECITKQDAEFENAVPDSQITTTKGVTALLGL